ncbi:protein POLLENLESS 3-like [Hibiscus syriacus]|uniref:protein POLLENLESS 3-like n=1 Tax=Hibiscus syriacus TaxID=106335 RepID=UPI001923D832|nr:protein POLLENLESS 3-like [Hibiscus syriacus]
MWSSDKNLSGRGFLTPQPPAWKKTQFTTVLPLSERKRISPENNGDFHVIHKVPASDSPYGRAKHVQLIDKDPNKAVSMFWAAINAGDSVDSALKDMAVVMKQLNRTDEAIDALKYFRLICPRYSQESLDNVLIELYKRSGRVDEEIEILQNKLRNSEEGTVFGGKKTKIARSQGKKIQITIEQEKSRILGNLAWAYLQQHNYGIAEQHYRKALSLESDKNKQCNLAICLMHMNRISEAKSLLQDVKASAGTEEMDESYLKSYERAMEMLAQVESQSVRAVRGTGTG